MDYKEWFDKLCETHEREMKQAELRGYARGYRQGLESDVVPKPCNGPKYDDWRLGDFVMQITQEFCEMVDEYKAFQMSGKFQLYAAFVDGILIGIGTLTSISKLCNVRRREIKMLVTQKWRHGGRPHKKPKAHINKCGHVIEIRRFLGMSTEEMGRGRK